MLQTYVKIIFLLNLVRREFLLILQAIETPEMLYDEVLEVECRVVPYRDDDLLQKKMPSTGQPGNHVSYIKFFCCLINFFNLIFIKFKFFTYKKAIGYDIN